MIFWFLMWRLIAAERTQDYRVYGPDEVKAFVTMLFRRAWKLTTVAVKATLVIAILCAMFYAAPALMTVVCGALALMWLLGKKL